MEVSSHPLLNQELFLLPDGASLHIHYWKSEGPARGAILFSHGLLEHAGRYAQWGQYIAKHGFDVLGVDARGHGLSDGERGWCKSFDAIIDDWEFMALRMSDYYSNLPVFIAGMSMGGGIALQTAVRLQDRTKKPKGLILFAPALKIRRWERFYWVGFFADCLVPRLRLKVTGINSLSRDPQVREEYLTDPLINSNSIRLHYGFENLRAAKYNRSLATRLELPLLLQQGTGDRVTLESGARRFIAQATSTDKTLICYPELYHDILHEPEKESVFRDTLHWLENRLS